MANTAASRTLTTAGEAGGSNLRRLLTLPGLTLLLALAGVGVAGYLTYTHFQEAALVCTFGGCHTVQESEYATLGPIPIAILGLGMYLAVAATAVLRIVPNRLVAPDVANLAAWGMAFAAVLYYAYLTYLELFVIEAICQWCVASAVITVAILIVESVMLYRNFLADPEDA
jgi:uncharacterized membrane protein